MTSPVQVTPPSEVVRPEDDALVKLRVLPKLLSAALRVIVKLDQAAKRSTVSFVEIEQI